MAFRILSWTQSADGSTPFQLLITLPQFRWCDYFPEVLSLRGQNISLSMKEQKSPFFCLCRLSFGKKSFQLKKLSKKIQKESVEVFYSQIMKSGILSFRIAHIFFSSWFYNSIQKLSLSWAFMDPNGPLRYCCLQEPWTLSSWILIFLINKYF